MTDLFVFSELARSGWWQAFLAAESGDGPVALAAYAALFNHLASRPSFDLATAIAEDLLWLESPLAKATGQARPIPSGLIQAACFDLSRLQRAARGELGARSEGGDLPPLLDLAEEPRGAVAGLRQALLEAPVERILDLLLERYRGHGAGPLAHFEALRWSSGALHGVPTPASIPLFDVDGQLAALDRNTEAFLHGLEAHHVLLYGPRGSGKSTAVRNLLPRHARGGLRLVELPPGELKDLPDVLARLRDRPLRYLLFVDDLSFEEAGGGFQLLKSLLEGSLVGRSGNALVYATSNRRHLVRERFGDRPDPLDEEVHAWDTHNERLALADRFGLTVTFPSLGQRGYVRLVEELAAERGIERPDLAAAAIRFAEWGNGYSGRTAHQFIVQVSLEAALGGS